jgi:RimJ/RimL family protein N-acetyltransferase
VSETPTLRDDGVVLRPLALDDAPALFIAMGDAEVQRFRRQDAHTDVGETERYIADTLQRSRAAWAITESGGEALGRLALRVAGDIGEFGIVLRRAAQRRGLGAKAIRLAEAFAFEELRLRMLNANIDSENTASIGLFTSLGFVRTELRAGDRATAVGLRDSVVLSKSAPQS